MTPEQVSKKAIRNPFLIDPVLGFDKQLEDQFVNQGILPDPYRDNLREKGFPTGNDDRKASLFAEAISNRLALGYPPTPDEIALYNSPMLGMSLRYQVDLLLDDKMGRGELKQADREDINQQLTDESGLRPIREEFRFDEFGERYRSERVGAFLDNRLNPDEIRIFQFEAGRDPALAHALAERQAAQAPVAGERPAVGEVNPPAGIDTSEAVKAEVPGGSTPQQPLEAVGVEPTAPVAEVPVAVQTPDTVKPGSSDRAEEAPAETISPGPRPVAGEERIQPKAVVEPVVVEEAPVRKQQPELGPVRRAVVESLPVEPEGPVQSERRGILASIGSFFSRMYERVRSAFTGQPIRGGEDRPLTQSRPRAMVATPNPSNAGGQREPGQNRNVVGQNEGRTNAPLQEERPVARQAPAETASQGVSQQPAPAAGERTAESPTHAAVENRPSQAAQLQPEPRQTQPTQVASDQRPPVQAAVASVEPPRPNLVRRAVNYVVEQVKSAYTYVSEQITRLRTGSPQPAGAAPVGAQTSTTPTEVRPGGTPDEVQPSVAAAPHVARQQEVSPTMQVSADPGLAQRVDTPAPAQTPPGPAPAVTRVPGEMTPAPGEFNWLDMAAYMSRVQQMAPEGRNALFNELSLNKLNPMERQVMGRLVTADPVIREEFVGYQNRQAESMRFVKGQMTPDEQQQFTDKIAVSPALKTELETAREVHQNGQVVRYQNGQMPETERNAFEQQLKTEPGLQQKLDARMQAVPTEGGQTPSPAVVDGNPVAASQQVVGQKKSQPTPETPESRQANHIVGALVEGLMIQSRGNKDQVEKLIRNLTPETRRSMAETLATSQVGSKSIETALDTLHRRMNSYGGPQNIFRELGKQQGLGISVQQRQKMDEPQKEGNRKHYLDADGLKEGRAQRVDETRIRQQEKEFDERKVARNQKISV